MNVRALTVVSLLAALTASSAWACELRYTLIDAAGNARAIAAGPPVELAQGAKYALRVEYYEDHRNCDVKPESTVFLLEGARWRPARETQPLVLEAAIAWTRPRTRTNVGEARFTAAAAGTWTLEILRECSRGGYRGELVFAVS